MEILMKVKCSPTAAPGSASHSTLKVVDHHSQRQPHTLAPSGSIAGGAAGGLRGPAAAAPPPLVPTAAAQHQQLHRTPSCLDYGPPAMDCCNTAAVAAHWHEQHRPPPGPDYMTMCDARCCRACNEPPCCSGSLAAYGGLTSPPTALLMQKHEQCALPMETEVFEAARYEYQEPEENFVSIDDVKVKGLLMRIGQERKASDAELSRRKAQENEERRRAEQEKKELAAATAAAAEKSRQQSVNSERRAKPQRTTTVTAIAPDGGRPMVYEIIELDDEEEREKLKRIKRQVERQSGGAKKAARPATQQTSADKRKSPNITLIPKGDDNNKPKRTAPIGASQHKIIAEIELLDSDSESEAEPEKQRRVTAPALVRAAAAAEEEEEDIPLTAAAVSCELDCEDDHEREDEVATADIEGSSRGPLVLASDDENVEFIAEHEEGPELRWEDLAQRTGNLRTYFECFLCGKKVQSSYNLRRHMMIHTGERPFGCDLCDRRFREFSDLKKHRRRHVNEPNFVCMVCRVATPTEHDPTRCSDCHRSVVIPSLRQPIATPAATPTPPPPPPPPLTKKTSTPPIAGNSPQTASPPALLPPPPLVITLPKGLHVSKVPPPLTPIRSASSSPTGSSSSAQLAGASRKHFPCPLCQRFFGTRHNLKRHFMIHTGEKPFSCAKCQRNFREYSTLKKHMVTHQRDRWYKCLRCPLKYRDYLLYMEHRRSQHGLEEAPSSSSNCSSNAPSPRKRSKTAAGRDHESDDYALSHDEDDLDDEEEFVAEHEPNDNDDSSSEAWLECCECCQRFTDIEAYMEHLKQHDPTLYIYECYVCKKTFETRTTLEQHMAVHDERQAEQAHVKRSLQQAS